MIDIAPVIQESIDAGIPFILPEDAYIGTSVILRRDNILIYGSHPSNNGNVLWTDKPIDMFVVEGRINRPILQGFKAEYRGNKIYGNECAVVRLGGWGEETRRFGVFYGYFDYDFSGDYEYNNIQYIRKPWNNNPDRGKVDANYIKWVNPNFDFAIKEPFDNVDNHACSYTGYGAHGFWVDYSSPISERTSWLHATTIKGYWKQGNTALKIDKIGEKFINSLTIDIQVDGFKTYFFLRGVHRSYINIWGQNRDNRMTNWVKWSEVEKSGNNGIERTFEEILIPYFYADDIQKTKINYWIYDRHSHECGRSQYGGFMRGVDIDVSGWQTLSSNTLLDLYYREGVGFNPHYSIKI